MGRKREAEAAARLRACRQALAARGSTVIREAIKGSAGAIVDWRHYPDGEVYDPASHVQYFYHRHGDAAGRAAPAERADTAGSHREEAEHGHFHLFLRGEGIPAGMTPLVLPELAVANAPALRQSAPLKRGSRDEVCHIVAIAVDGHGQPTRLFTTNRWVTGETWYRADDVIGMLDRVRLAGNPPLEYVDRWIEALVRLFRSEITVLLRNRDQAIIDWRWRWPRSNVFEDPRLEVTSSFAIDVEARLALAEAAEFGPEAAPAPRPVRGLPSMAEGWGA